MKKQFILFAIIILSLSATAFADVKIKSKQTVSGQSIENTTYIKGKRQRTESMGGMMISLTQCDLRRGVQLNSQTKTYIISPFETADSNAPTTVSANKKDNVVRAGGNVTTTISTKDTGERKQMFGFTAKHLIITMETVSSPDACNKSNTKMVTDGWYIDAEFVLDCDQYSQYRNYTNQKYGGCQDKYNVKQIGTAKRGYPLYEKMTMFDDNGKESFSTVNEVVELSKSTLNASLFEVPEDYREVNDSTQMYNVASLGNSGNSAALPSSIQLPQVGSTVATSVGAKKTGTVRIGVSVKAGSVGEGLNANELTTAIQNSLGEYLKGTEVEIVALEAKLASAMEAEAKQKDCDLILFANVSHKKGGGGGFGMFSKVIAPAIGRTGIGHTGSVVGNAAGQVATQAIISAGEVSANVKSKDEITLEVKLNRVAGNAVLTTQYKGKAKSDGEDIISPIIEQLAQAIVDGAKK